MGGKVGRGTMNDVSLTFQLGVYLATGRCNNMIQLWISLVRVRTVNSRYTFHP